MKLNDIKDKLESSVIALATCSKEDHPHNIAVACIKVKDNKIVITDNYMQKTKENIKQNPQIALVFWKGDKGFSIEGKAEYFDYGKWLEFVKSLPENKNFPAKGAIVMNVESIKNL